MVPLMKPLRLRSEHDWKEPALAQVSKLSALAPFLPDPERQQAVAYGVELLGRTQDWAMHMEGIDGFDALVPLLSKPQISDFWESAMRIDDRGAQLILQAAIFPKEDRLSQEVAATFSPTFRWLNDQMEAWEELRNFVRQSAWQQGSNSKGWDWTAKSNKYRERMHEYISRLERANFITEKKRVEKEISHWNGKDYPYITAIELRCTQAAQSKGNRRKALINEAIRIANLEGHPLLNADYVRLILPLCEPEHRIALTQKLFPNVQEYWCKDIVAATVASLLPFSAKADRAELLMSSIQKVLEQQPGTFFKINFALDQVFCAYSESWADLSIEDALKTWGLILLELKRLPRADVLCVLAVLAPLVDRFGGISARGKIMAAVQEIVSSFP
jgi:hypothetical protein